MTKNIDVNVRITADGKGLVVEARAAKEAIGGIGDATKKASSESSAFTAQTARQGNATSQAANQANAHTASLGSLKTGLIAATGAYVTLGAAMAVTAVSFKRFVEFDKQLAGVSTLIAGTAEQMAALESASRSLATTYGKMPQEQAKTFYQVISSGVTDVAKATELLDEANKLSVAGMADLFATADSMTSIMNAYGAGVKSAADVSDILFIGTLAGKTTIDELASSLGRVAPIAESVGVGFDELTSAISALTLGGISTAESVTGVRAILAAVIKPSSEAVEVAKALGIEFDSAAIKAKGFGGFMEDLVAKTQGSEEALGLLFGGVEAIVPALALSGKAGESFNSIMQQMGARAGATQTAFDKMADSPGFKVDRLMAAISDAAITLGDSLAGVLIPAAEGATRALNNFFGAKNLSAIDKQKQSIAEMRAELESLGNRKHVPLIGDLIFDKKQADLLSQRIESATADLSKMSESARESARAGNAVTQSVKEEASAKSGLAQVNKILAGLNDKSADSAKKQERAAQQAVDSADKTIAAFRRETQEIGLNVIQKRMMAAATEAAKAPTQALAQEIMASAQAWAQATQAQEGNLAMQKSQAQAAEERARAEKDAANQVKQEWNGLWGGVETTAKTAFIQFAAHGKSAMQSIGESIKLSIIDVLYQLTIRKWMINIGASLSGLAGAGAANAATSGGGSILDLANSGLNAANLLKSGFGTTGMLGRGISAAGRFVGSGSIAAFGAGMGVTGTQAAAQAGASALWGASGASTAASMGASFASFAGPAIAIAAVDQIVRMLAGDKMIGGGVGKVLNFVPVLGPLLNGLFGRGPMKQQGTSLTGQIGAEGFESGMLQTRFKAKGGLFRSDKIDYARVDAVTGDIFTDNNKLLDFAKDLSKAGKELFGLINDTTKQTSASLRQIGRDMGISTEGIDKFGYSINLLSEKGKMLTEEQIGQEITKITDGLAHQLIPQIGDLAKRGETALQAVSRLGIEFTTLVDAAALVLGKSAADARAMITGASFEGRTGFVDNAGGADALMQKEQTFAANFLSEAERIAPTQEQLNEQLGKLGLSTSLTRDQFRGLVQSFGQVNGVSEETLQSLLNLMPAFLTVTNYTDNLAKSAQDLADIEQARVRGINTTQAGMEIELMRLMGNESGALTKARLDELQTIDASLIPLQQAIFRQQDLNKERDKATAIANERTGLETQLMQMQGDTAALRQRELDALDPLNRGLKQYIFALEDEKILKEKAGKQLDTAFGALQRAVDAERKGVARHISDIAQSVNKLKDLSGSLRSALSRMQISGNEGADRAAAQAQISAALAIAKASGKLPEAESLRRALDVVAQPSEDLFGSFTDYMRDFARTAADINSLDGLTQNQLGIEDQALRLAESQMTALDGILTTAQAELDAIRGVDNSIQTLAGALQGFASAKAAVGAAAGGGGSPAASNIPPLPSPPSLVSAAITPPIGSTGAPAGVTVLGGPGNPKFSGRDIAAFINSGVTPEQILGKAIETGVNAQQIASAMAASRDFQLPSLRSFIESKGLVPGFADGGLHGGGLRIVGERGPELEFTGPSRIVSNPESRKLLDLAEVVAELKALRAEMAAIKANTGSTATNTQKTSDLLDNVSAGGGPLLVTQVS